MTNKEIHNKLEEAEAICAILMISLRRSCQFPIATQLEQVARAEHLLKEVREHLSEGGKNETT